MATPRSGKTKRIDLTDEQVRQAETMAGIGLTLPKIALVLGISESTLKRQKKTNRVLASALALGLARAEFTVGTYLWKRIEAGDMRAIRWWEMTRAGRSERRAITSLPMDPSAMTDEQLARIAAGEDPFAVLGYDD